MATKGRRYKDPSGLLDYGEPPEDQISLPSDLFFGEGGYRGTPYGEPADYGDYDPSRQINPAPPPRLVPVGPQPQQAPRPAPAGSGFLGGAPTVPGGRGAPGLDVNEYLAKLRGTSLQALQGWDYSADQGFLGAVEQEADRRTSEILPRNTNLLNPIQSALYQQRLAVMRRNVINDPEFRRQYQMRTQGYDPRYGRVTVPAGFDPYTDADFLRASAEAQQRRQEAAAAAGAGVGSAYDAALAALRAQLARQRRELSFFGPPPSLGRGEY